MTSGELIDFAIRGRYGLASLLRRQLWNMAAHKTVRCDHPMMRAPCMRGGLPRRCQHPATWFAFRPNSQVIEAVLCAAHASGWVRAPVAGPTNRPLRLPQDASPTGGSLATRKRRRS